MTEPTYLPPSLDLAMRWSAQVAPYFVVDHIEVRTAAQGHDHLALYGRLRGDSAVAFGAMSEVLARNGYLAHLTRRGDWEVLVGTPHVMARRRRDPLAPVLFVLTIASTLISAAWWQTGDLAAALHRPWLGLPFSLGLMGVLTAHELGHWLMSRRLGVAASLPYFIPMPLVNLFGTMGAIMRMEEIPRNRRELLAIGAAGPLAGMAVAIPLLLVGLLRSTVEPLPAVTGAIMEGNSILYALIKFAVFRRWLPGHGLDVMLDPMAFGAWAGMFVTALNLIPAGQLDGGHVARSLLGSRASWLNRAAVVATLALSLAWEGWLIWSVILLVFGQRSLQPLDDVTPLTLKYKALAALVLLLFVLLFTPQPLIVLS